MFEQKAEVAFNRRVALDTYLLGLRSASISATAEPGHFVMLRVRHGMDPLLRRPFSICGTRGNDLFLILYRVIGRGTDMMSAVNPGELLSVLGPLGVAFDLPKSGQQPILVAGGVGIAPLIFLSNACKPTEVILFSGYSSVSQVVPEAETGLVNTRILIATDDGTEGHHGPVTDLLENHLTRHRIQEPRVFACGPLPMLKKVATITSKLDVPCQVSLETAMACGLGACQGCAVKGLQDQEKAYLHVCCDGPVFDARILDWEAM